MGGFKVCLLRARVFLRCITGAAEGSWGFVSFRFVLSTNEYICRGSAKGREGWSEGAMMLHKR